MNRPQEQILQALGEYHYLTAVQLVRVLGYAAASKREVQRQAKALVEQGLVNTLYLARVGRGGSSPLVYYLTPKAIKHLETQGLVLPLKRAKAQVEAPTSLFLSHTLAVNDLLILSWLLTKRAAWIKRDDVRHELLLKQTLHDAVVPDAFVDFHVQTAHGTWERLPVMFELDRGTIDKVRFREKIAALLVWSETEYVHQFETAFLTIAFVAPGMPQRAADLKRFIEQELTKQQRLDKAELFWITALDPAITSPEGFFLMPSFALPFSAEQAALITSA